MITDINVYPPQKKSKNIGSIRFSPLSNAEIANISSLAVVESTLYNRSTNRPIDGGPLDIALGTNLKGELCKTCKKGFLECPGHYGHVKLILPLFHIGYFRRTIMILQCICKACSRILLPINKREEFELKNRRGIKEYIKKQNALKRVVDLCKKTKVCPYCQFEVGKIKKKAGESTKVLYYSINSDASDAQRSIPNNVEKFKLYGLEDHSKRSSELETEFLKQAEIDLNPLRVLELFNQIPKEDFIFFQMDERIQKPADLLVSNILVPPLCVRPTVKVGSDKTNEDDLTIKILDICKQNENIKRLIREGKPPAKIDEAWYMMQCIFNQYINSEAPGLPKELQGSNATRGISQRLKGKTGRFRGNLSGKRVDFSARTVISPDPNLRIDQVIIPKQMALILTFPEEVTQRNIFKMKQLVENGSEKYPGATHIQKYGENVPMTLRFNRKKAANELNYGDVVHRHIIDNDLVLFNRQPSLHKISIMGFRAKIGNYRTLRFNECVCTPFNADFDGDEMNIHVPQTYEATSETLHLLSTTENIASPKNGEPIIALTQDFLTAAYLITQKNIFLDRSQFTRMCAYFQDGLENIDIPPPSILKPVELWTGKQVISTLLIPNHKMRAIVNLQYKEKNYNSTENKEFFDSKDGYVFFQNSELLSGNLGKGVLGSGSKGLFYCLLKDNSKYVAALTMTRFSKWAGRWLSDYGMTLGIGDVTPSAKLMKNNTELMNIQFNECQKIIDLYEKGLLELKTGCTAEQTLEASLTKVLNNVRDECGKKCFNELPAYNPALIMAISGSKGSQLNLSQMIACVGQQTVGGARISNGFKNRTLPHFKPGSKDPNSRGFVRNSFFTGLEATEFFFHTMGGREGLIDTAVKTADTGYMQRRLVKALEDLKLHYDYTVRSSDSSIIQFIYGENF